MFILTNRIVNGFLKDFTSLEGCIRFASKKAAGGTRNKKQAKGSRRGWKIQDGHYVYPGDILATQNKPNWMAGLNVAIAGRLNVIAVKEGRVRITCETPDLNYDHTLVQKFFGNRQGHQFYKKYYHVIPKEQHNRFKLVDQI